MSNNYGEILCQATEILAQHLIDKVNYDKTILCTIINDTEKELGKYRVQNSEAIFDAYATNGSFKKNDQVYVSIPMGDWNEQKLIVSKKVNNLNEPIAYKDPFDSFVNITNNLVGAGLSTQGLIANEKSVASNDGKEQKLLWSYNKNDSGALIKSTGDVLNGYTRLAINADFQTWLKDFNIVAGDFGLNLIIELEPEDADDIKSDGNTISSNIKICTLNCSDMVGNPYNYESFYSQKKLFDISTLKNIKTMELWFYQKEGSFLNRNLETVKPHKAPNIFVKNIGISLGYDTNSFENDTLIIYTMDTIKYDVEKTPLEDNHKKLYARWIHRFEDDIIKVVELEDNIDYTLTWYRYEQGARSHTVWSGVDWNPLSIQQVTEKVGEYTIVDSDWIDYNNNSMGGANTPLRNLSYNQTWLLPDTTRAEEKIKAIIEYDGNIIDSAELIFSNTDETVNKATVDAIQALSINCEDESFGNYLVYNLGGQIIDNAEAQKIREFKAYFNSASDKKADDEASAELVEASSIEWIIPSSNTMIDVEDFISGNIDANYEKDGYYHIFRFCEKPDGTNKTEDDGIDGNIRNQNSQRYKIKSFYTHNYSNNIIKCIVTKNKIKYTTTKELTFGPAGTSGTDYTFVLDFNNGITALTLKSDYKESETIPSVIVQARLYDYTGKEIPNLDIRDIQWSLDEEKLENDDKTDNVVENDYIKIIPQAEKNKVEIQLKDSVDKVPEDNFTILKAVLKASSGVGDDGWGDYDLFAYLPIPIRSSRNYQFISGTTTIAYNSLGYLDNFFQNPYSLYYMEQDSENANLIVKNGEWKIVSGVEDDPYAPKPYQNSDGQYYIRPINIYVEDSMQELCAVGSIDEEIIWSQPIYVTQNKYPSSIVNKWNGELTIDNENNAILAAKMVAGKKHDDNTFSGVMMGDWSGNEVVYEEIQDPDDPTKTITQPKKNAAGATETAIAQHTGIYGFQKGIASFGFRDDGTAFIGKPGAGRLEFNGDKSIIESNAFASGLGGLSLDFDKGLIEMYEPEKKHDKKKSIILDASATSHPLTIGEYFKVNWDGSLQATNGHFSGTIYAWDGYFSGSITASSIDGSTITGTTISAAEIEGGTIYGSEIVTDKLYAGTMSGFKYDKYTRKDTKSKWVKADTYIFTKNHGTIYYPNNNAATALTKFEYVADVSGSKVAHLGTYTGGIPSIDPDTGEESTTETQICGIDVMDGIEYPLSLRANQRVLLRSNVSDVMIMSGGQVGFWGKSLRCHVPKDQQYGIYARFA